MSVKLFSPSDPFDPAYALANRLGTWYPNPGPGACPECGSSGQKRVAPLVIEWQASSDLIGDFTWPAGGEEVVVSQRVREGLEPRFQGFEFLPIEMYQDPKLKRTERMTKRTEPRVWLPYEGSALWDLQAPAWCSLDLGRSNVSTRKVCSTCGRVYYSFPRRQDRHFVVDPSTWKGDHAFRLRELPLVTVTEEVKQCIESQEFTNVRFWFWGEIPN